MFIEAEGATRACDARPVASVVPSGFALSTSFVEKRSTISSGGLCRSVKKTCKSLIRAYGISCEAQLGDKMALFIDCAEQAVVRVWEPFQRQGSQVGIETENQLKSALPLLEHESRMSKTHMCASPASLLAYFDSVMVILVNGCVYIWETHKRAVPDECMGHTLALRMG